MADKYESFAALAAREMIGRDYCVRAVERTDSPVLILAPHGGTIEVGTSELAELIAGSDHSLFIFEGLKPDGANRELHITSHRFDHPACLALSCARPVTIAVHGCSGESQVFVGGLDTQLTEFLAQELSSTGLSTRVDGHRYPGRHPLNICNRNAKGRGAQLEFTHDLRTGPGRIRIASSVRAGLAAYLRVSASRGASRPVEC